MERAFWRSVRYYLADFLHFPVLPVQLRFAVTKCCNSRCIMCGLWRTDKAAIEEIAADEILKIGRNNHWFLRRVAQVAFTGGEPTLRKDLANLVKAAHQVFPKAFFSLNTNGFDSRQVLSVVQEIMEFHHHLAVIVSLDGLGEAHNWVRGVPGVFLKVVETIDSLVALRQKQPQLRLSVNFVCTNYNSNQLLLVFNFCQKQGVEFNPIYPGYGQLFGEALLEIEDIRLEPGTHRWFLRDLKEARKIKDSLLCFYFERQLQGYCRDFDCWAGRITFLIESDCRVFPNTGCPSSFSLGSLREVDYSFKRILKSHQAKRLLKRLRTCRLCHLPCEILATLTGPEALAGYFKQNQLLASPERNGYEKAGG